MNKHSKKARIAVILGVILALIMSSMSISYAAAGTKKMTVYDQVIVKGKYAYCAANQGIYRVNLKKGTKKRIVKYNDSESGDPGLSQMRIYKGYLYYTAPNGIADIFYRVKLNGTNKKCLAEEVDLEYAISNGKLYYEYYDVDKDKIIKKVMKLNGKNKKRVAIKLRIHTRNQIKRSTGSRRYL